MIYAIIAALGLPSDVAINSKFEAWKRAEHKVYSTVEEEAAALRAFVSNDHIIEEHNTKNMSYWLGHNAFSDLTWEEFQQRHMGDLYLNKPPKNSERVHLKGIGQPLDDAVDWTTKGAVTPVKNQGRCGACSPCPSRPRRHPPPRVGVGRRPMCAHAQALSTQPSQGSGCPLPGCRPCLVVSPAAPSC